MRYILLIILMLFLSYGCKTHNTNTNDVLRTYYNPNRYTTTSVDLIEFNGDGERLTIMDEYYPVHPNCKRENSKKCFVEMLNNEVKKHFTNELAEETSVKGEFKIFCKFQIDTTGSIKEISVRAPHPRFKNPAHTTIKNIPKIYPYLKNNIPSNLIVHLSITYLIE